MSARTAIALLYPAAPARRAQPDPAMMEERPAPPWLVLTIHVVQGNDGAIGVAMVAVAAALFTMMGVGSLAAWQTGLL